MKYCSAFGPVVAVLASAVACSSETGPVDPSGIPRLGQGGVAGRVSVVDGAAGLLMDGPSVSGGGTSQLGAPTARGSSDSAGVAGTDANADASLTATTLDMPLSPTSGGATPGSVVAMGNTLAGTAGMSSIANVIGGGVASGTVGFVSSTSIPITGGTVGSAGTVAAAGMINAPRSSGIGGSTSVAGALGTGGVTQLGGTSNIGTPISGAGGIGIGGASQSGGTPSTSGPAPAAGGLPVVTSMASGGAIGVGGTRSGVAGATIAFEGLPNLGSVGLGQTGPSTKAVIWNNGPGPSGTLVFSVDDPTQFLIEPGLCNQVSLNSASGCAFFVRFAPQSLGPQTATLTVHGDTSITITGQLNATGVNASTGGAGGAAGTGSRSAAGGTPGNGGTTGSGGTVTSGTAELSIGGLGEYGTVSIGKPGLAHTFTVTNTGTATSGALSVQADYSRDQFQITADHCSGMVLNSGAGCAFDVVFAPLQTGVQTTGIHVIGGSNVSASMQVSGTGSNGW